MHIDLYIKKFNNIELNLFLNFCFVYLIFFAYIVQFCHCRLNYVMQCKDAMAALRVCLPGTAWPTQFCVWPTQFIGLPSFLVHSVFWPTQFCVTHPNIFVFAWPQFSWFNQFTVLTQFFSVYLLLSVAIRLF